MVRSARVSVADFDLLVGRSWKPKKKFPTIGGLGALGEFSAVGSWVHNRILSPHTLSFSFWWYHIHANMQVTTLFTILAAVFGVAHAVAGEFLQRHITYSVYANSSI